MKYILRALGLAFGALIYTIGLAGSPTNILTSFTPNS